MINTRPLCVVKGADKMTIVSISVPEDLLTRFDEVSKAKGFRTRSDSVREAMRSAVDEDEWEGSEGDNQVVITMVYDEMGPRGELSVLQHRYDEIQMMLHLHLEKGQCMEVFIARGSNAVLREILGKIRNVKGVRSIRFISTSGPSL
ncbi:MAG: CopG family transcriptional regulator, nickel-responsive regulator [Candidatus Thermoplasmatota archaeon]|nr:CopG family transcriptional regulator, nickel-responsive regulator [Candidatus Thermoplasmatota archaeon]